MSILHSSVLPPPEEVPTPGAKVQNLLSYFVTEKGKVIVTVNRINYTKESLLAELMFLKTVKGIRVMAFRLPVFKSEEKVEEFRAILSSLRLAGHDAVHYGTTPKEDSLDKLSGQESFHWSKSFRRFN